VQRSKGKSARIQLCLASGDQLEFLKISPPMYYSVAHNHPLSGISNIPKIRTEVSQAATAESQRYDPEDRAFRII